MTATVSWKTGSIPTTTVMEGSLCLSLILLVLTATMVLTLMSIYQPRFNSQTNEYAIDSLMLKSLYTDSSSTFLNGEMVDISMLPTLCSTVFQNERQNTAVRRILENFCGSGSYYDSVNARRRRSLFGLLELYMIGKARLFYSTSCRKESNRSEPINSAYRSYCIRKRLTECNALYKNPTENFVEWTPISTKLKYSSVNSNNTYTILSSPKVFGVRSSLAVTITNNFDLSIKTQNEIVQKTKKELAQEIQSYCIRMRPENGLIVPYISYITLGMVTFIIILMVVFKVVARDNQFLSNSQLYIYSQPDLNQRIHNANKKHHKNNFLSSKSNKPLNSVPESN
ncbi:unnamed protein product [Rotaria socialis]|uniref:Uncharacterized protein n=1 Tax=Rotaria socialis TaxID=392032 RepID=A0A820TTK9_9BILA|nr:unnamed protein product [Rotaria socialis]CAF4475844.1 unnamed protein product [Rotaria socialis]